MKPTSPLAKRARELRQQGRFYREIAAELGVPVGSVPWLTGYKPPKRPCPECGQPCLKASARCRDCVAGVRDGLAVCGLCKEWLPLAAFSPSRQSPNRGVRAACRACEVKAATTRQKAEPEKKAARIAVYWKKRSGRLKPKPCEVCGSLDVQAHHDDYAKPLDVRWLCPVHHAALRVAA